MTGQPFTLAHAQELEFVREACFVGDGRRVAYTVAEVVSGARDINSLWLVHRDGTGLRQLAEELGDVGAVAPSPDGQLLAVVADVAGKRQICLVSLAGGSPTSLTELPQGVGGRPVWSPEGRTIAFTAPPAEQRDRTRPYRVDRMTYRFDRHGLLDDAVQDLYVVDVETGAVRQLTDDRSMNAEPRWSPDGLALCYLVSFRAEREWRSLPELHVLELASGRSRAIVDSWGGAFCAEWCTDGRQITFVGSPEVGRLYATQKLDLWTVDVTGGRPECRTANVLAGVRSGILTDIPVCDEMESARIRVVDDVAYVGAQVCGDAVIYRVGLDGPEAVDRAVDTHGSAYLVDVDPHSGAVLHLATSVVEPPELMIGNTRLTGLNDGLIAPLARPKVWRLEATAADRLRTEAWALTPPGTQGPWPTVLCIHGGPYSAFGTTYMIDFELLVGAGFAVVFHNFRGSCGYGSDFSQKITGSLGPGGALDHHAAVDEAVRLGIADPERLGVYGLSYGGFSTCWLVGTSSRFKAAIAENPVTNWASLFGVADSAWWIPPELGGTPNEIPGVYREQSPLSYAENCTTPLLFIVGEDDLRCPPMESEQYYRVLKSNGVPTEMLRLPDAAHTGSYNGPVAARVAQNEALIEWFTRHLGAKDPTTVAATGKEYRC